MFEILKSGVICGNTDSLRSDYGWPSVRQIDDGMLYTVYYQKQEPIQA